MEGGRNEDGGGKPGRCAAGDRRAADANQHWAANLLSDSRGARRTRPGHRRRCRPGGALAFGAGKQTGIHLTRRHRAATEVRGESRRREGPTRPGREDRALSVQAAVNRSEDAPCQSRSRNAAGEIRHRLDSRGESDSAAGEGIGVVAQDAVL